MKPQEKFYAQILELRPMIEGLEAQTLSDYQSGSFRKIARRAADSYQAYSQALISQILAEIQNCIAESVKRITEVGGTSFLLKPGNTIKNNNIRFFCEESVGVPGKYALLFQHKSAKTVHFFIADYDGNVKFQIGFKTDPLATHLVNIEGAYDVFILASLTPYFRSYVAAHQEGSDIHEAIATGNIGSYFPPRHIQHVSYPGLNQSQSDTLSAFLRLNHGVQIMKGPPGTGKTTTIVSILFELCHRNADRKWEGPILVCGPSNKSVAVIAQSFRKKFPQIPIVLCEREDANSALVSVLADANIKSAQIIFATLSKSGSSLLTKAINKIDALIIDEAGQASESDMLIPFQFQPEKVLIVGDECQLPPTVLSADPEQFNYHWSMLSRLITECRQPHFLLDTQYRMHPEVSEFPVEAFYDNQVNDGVTAEQRAPKGDLVPYQVIDVEGMEELDPVLKSYKNVQEAYMVIVLIKEALEKGYQSSDISVITPYKAQTKLLQELVAGMLNIESMAINTIDSFQGEESPVVFVSMVRANALGRIGFAKDFRRLNVAITRPKEVLRILVNGATFNPLHPQNEFQESMLHVFSEFHRIPLPGRDSFYRSGYGSDDDDYDSYRKHDTRYSEDGYRPSLQSYSRRYRFNGLLYLDVAPDHSSIERDICMHYGKRGVGLYGSFNGIFLYRKDDEVYALVMHDRHRYEIVSLSWIIEEAGFIIPWPTKSFPVANNDVGDFCLINFGSEFEDLVTENCKDWLFTGPKPIYRFAKLLRHFKDEVSSNLGKRPIFFLPTLPKGTHVIQDILDNIKEWKDLSFSGLPNDMFLPLRYNTQTRISEEFEDYGDPYDNTDTYCSCGYATVHNDYDEEEMESEDLVFENHYFYRCDLRGINFHKSVFINTTFDECNVENCKVNFKKMDEISKASFLKCLKKSRQSVEPLPTDQLVLNAMQRGLYYGGTSSSNFWGEQRVISSGASTITTNNSASVF